jgi:hypothetical protein
MHDSVPGGKSVILDWASLLTSRGGVYNSSGFVVTQIATQQLTRAACLRLEVWLRARCRITFPFTSATRQFADLSSE